MYFPLPRDISPSAYPVVPIPSATTPSSLADVWTKSLCSESKENGTETAFPSSWERRGVEAVPQLCRGREEHAAVHQLQEVLHDLEGGREGRRKGEREGGREGRGKSEKGRKKGSLHESLKQYIYSTS